ncbi:isoprenyl transferase [Folsomia candida]|uniref:Alkyl transferase n=1 Tax=Folsomia candida TaxID=158441 RepID=A0A226E726_FOLCA|nr:isoprenyl transferase [Folsomia candida]OXA53392.1 Dehydrodolichyl diphosphate syntase complex subunit DHDDS [Folsomia candida]
MEDYSLSLLEILATAVARMGPIPEHIAVIMDGNRRYAKSKGLKAIQGHQAGAAVSSRVEKWGKAIGCKEVTVYAFSSENFKRTKEEVDDLMELMCWKAETILQDVETGKITDVSFNVIGDWDKVPHKLKCRMANLVEKTKNFKPYKLNVAVAYTGREGMLRSLKAFEGLKSDESVTEVNHNSDKGQTQQPKWNEYLVEQAQNMANMRPVDMLIRTGGDLRLSDFMLWEASHAYVHLTPKTWPELSFSAFMHAIFMYQVHRRQIPKPISAKDSLSPEELIHTEKTLQGPRAVMWARNARFAKKDPPLEKTSEPFCPKKTFLDSLQDLLSF